MAADLFAGSFSGSQILGRCILSVASPFWPVSDDAVGGAERTIAILDHAIVESGGKSLVIASEDSRVSGTLIPISIAQTRFTSETRNKTCHEIHDKIEQTLRDKSVDLIHIHDADFHHYLPQTEVPKLITLHLPSNRYPKSIFTNARGKNEFLHSVSERQHHQYPDSEALLSPITSTMFAPEYLRRYEIIIRGCTAHVAAFS